MSYSPPALAGGVPAPRAMLELRLHRLEWESEQGTRRAEHAPLLGGVALNACGDLYLLGPMPVAEESLARGAVLAWCPPRPFCRFELEHWHPGGVYQVSLFLSQNGGEEFFTQMANTASEVRNHVERHVPRRGNMRWSETLARDIRTCFDNRRNATLESHPEDHWSAFTLRVTSTGLGRVAARDSRHCRPERTNDRVQGARYWLDFDWRVLEGAAAPHFDLFHRSAGWSCSNEYCSTTPRKKRVPSLVD